MKEQSMATTIESKLSVVEKCGLPPVFAHCLADRDNRYMLFEPFCVGDHIYATDGKVCCRIRRSRKHVVNNPAFPPPADKLPWDVSRYADDPIDIPDLPEPKPKSCEKCNGTGGLDCEDCSGTGYVECCECGHETECERCDGEGKLGDGKCPDCGGCGQATGGEKDACVNCGPVGLNVAYLRPLLAAGASFYAPKETGSARPIRWTCGDVEGLLMPCVKIGGEQ